MAMAKAALVTGGARRIGAHLVSSLVADGYAVGIHCNTSTVEAEALAVKIRAGGGVAEVLTADLADADAVDQLIPQAIAKLGPLGVLVNNASIFEPDGMPNLQRAAYDTIMAVNFTTPVFLTNAFAAHLPYGAEGLVVQLLDQRVLKPTPMFLSYAMAKQALYGALPMMAQALAPHIRVNGIAPGPTLQSVRQRPEDFAFQAESTLLHRGAALQEFTDALRLLISARSMTGQTLVLDGGQHLIWQTPDVVNAGE